jgi:hypothetical protein
MTGRQIRKEVVKKEVRKEEKWRKERKKIWIDKKYRQRLGRERRRERKKKKENNKNDDILSLCDLFMYIYLFILFKIYS